MDTVIFKRLVFCCREQYVGVHMNQSFRTVLKASEDDCHGVFFATASQFFGRAPAFQEVIEAIRVFERKLNSDDGL